jgi:glycosyltransferase involved in cell wall biosynthesis
MFGMSGKNILFITLLRVNSISDRGIYNDLLRNLQNKGNKIFVVSPLERRLKLKSNLTITENSQILNIKTLNIQKTNLLEKGLATLVIEYQYLFAIKKYFKEVKFDIIVYSTPPITFSKVINYIKKRDSAFSYLLLKDIFPQNAIDLKLFRRNGLIHKFFLKKEKQLYVISDYIGCMSQANVDYIKKHNPNLDFNKILINPNSIYPNYTNYSLSDKESVKEKYQIPLDKKIFIYGGNLGKPQGLDFLLETIRLTKRYDVYFLIVGSGTELSRIKSWFKKNKPKNATLIPMLTKIDYDNLLPACDVGLIFLNKKFTIPNYPSRLLSYMEMKMPIIAATDKNSDIGMDIEKNKCGFGILSGDIKAMHNAINRLTDEVDLFNEMKENSWIFLNKDFHVDRSSKLIMQSINEK